MPRFQETKMTSKMQEFGFEFHNPLEDTFNLLAFIYRSIIMAATVPITKYIVCQHMPCQAMSYL